MENIKEINLTELMTALLRKIWLIILLAVVAGAVTYVYTANFVTEMYKSHITVYVNSSSQNNTVNISATELATSQRLVYTYIEMVKSESVLELVEKEIAASYPEGKAPSAAKIKGMISASPLKETEIFEVVVSNSDPNLACDIANAIGKVAPGKIEEYAVGSSTKIIDWAKPAKAPYAPNVTRNATIGMAVGAVAAICIIVLQTLMDVRVKSEEDLTAISSAPVLGLIPDLAMDNKDGYGYSGYTGYKYSAYKAKGSNSKSGGNDV